MNSVDTAESCI